MTASQHGAPKPIYPLAGPNRSSRLADVLNLENVAVDVIMEGRVVELSLSKPAEIISERTRSIVYPLPQLWFAWPDNLWHVPAEGS